MSLSNILQNYKELKGEMLEQGVINEIFLRLEVIDENDPNFAFDTVDLFFANAEHVISEINKAVDMRKINLASADAYMHRLKGSSSDVGIGRIKKLTQVFRTFYLEGSVDGCLQTVRDLNQEYSFCKNRLMSLKNLAEQIRAAGGVVPRTGASF